MDIKNIDTTKYNIVNQINSEGEIVITLYPKVRNCLYCTQQIKPKVADFITWKDDEGKWRKGYFCREHSKVVTKLLKHERKV